MKLKKVYVEITNICNLRCRFCAKSERPKRSMAVSEFDFILSKLARFTDHIYPHVLGEPLTHPDIGEMLEICGRHSIKASLTTNAVLLNIKQNELINKPCLKQINYSLHSLNELENGNNIDMTIGGIAGFIEKSGAMYHNLRLWNIGSGEANAEIIASIEKHFGEKVTGEKKQMLAERVFLHFSDRFDWPGGEGERFTNGRCLALRHDFAILSDGTVVPCCLDYDGAMALGNIYTGDLGEMLAGDRAKQIRHGFAMDVPVESFCRSCGFAAKKFAE